nr:MAG TPA: hypothetical protein [Caudoviricetes sp.]
MANRTFLCVCLQEAKYATPRRMRRAVGQDRERSRPLNENRYLLSCLCRCWHQSWKRAAFDASG